MLRKSLPLAMQAQGWRSEKAGDKKRTIEASGPHLGPFLRPQKTMHVPPTFLKLTDLVVFDDAQQLSN